MMAERRRRSVGEKDKEKDGRKSRAFAGKINRLSTASDVRENVKSATRAMTMPPLSDSKGSAIADAKQAAAEKGSNVNGALIVNGTQSFNSISSPVPLNPPEQGRRQSVTRSTNKVFGKTFEKKLAVKANIIAADPLRDILQFPLDDVQVQTIPREFRTFNNPIPAEFQRDDAHFVPFSRESLRFFKSGWHTVQRKDSHLARMRAAAISDEGSLPILAFEADLPSARNIAKSDQAGYGLSTDPNIPVVVGVFDVNNLGGSSGRSSAEPRSRTLPMGTKIRKYPTSSDIPVSSKWPRRKVQLRFESNSGPLVLELFKDAKGNSVTDTVKLIQATFEISGPTLNVTLKSELCWKLLFDSAEQAQEWKRKIHDKQTELIQARVRKRERLASDDQDTPVTPSSTMQDIEDRMTIDSQNSHLQHFASTESNGILSVFRGEALPRLMVDMHDFEPIRLDSQVPTGTVKFSVVCRELLFNIRQLRESTVKSSHNIEPFYCTLALYDVREGVKLSEDFHFDLTHPDEFQGHGAQTNADIISKSFEAIFSVEFPREEVYLVLNVEKVLQGDISNATDIYSKQGEKAVQKQIAAVKSCLSKSLNIGGVARMPFVWAARQVFPVTGQKAVLDYDKPFSNFYKHEPDKLREDEFMSLLSEYHKYATQGSKFRSQIVQGGFKCSFLEYVEKFPTVTHDLHYLKPNADPNMKPRREILSFKQPGKVSKYCNSEFCNYLYIYPTAVNFTAKKAASNSKARNIMLRIQVLESTVNPQQQSGLDVIFGRSSSKCITSSTTSAVLYHNKQPQFNSEIKIRLPANTTDRHHVFFTFYHIAVEDKKSNKNKTGEETVVGYAWLPLLVEGAEIEDGQHNLMVAAAGANLPETYLYTKSVGMGQVGGPKITWIDPTKPIFQLKVRRCSTISVSDPSMMTFFSECDVSKMRDGRLVDAIAGLHKADHDIVIANFPVLFNQLFTLIASGDSNDEVDEVSRNAVVVLIYAVGVIHEEMRGSTSTRNHMLRSYVYHVATTPEVSSRSSLFHELVRYLVVVMKDTYSSRSSDTFLKHSWFFLSLISKIMAEHAAQYPPESSRETGQPSARFSAEYNEAILELIISMAAEMTKKVQHDLDVVKNTNVNIALFMNDCFSVMDRGTVFIMIQKYLDVIASSTSQTSVSDFLILCKIQFLEVVCNYEHYVPLNLVLEPSVPDEAVSKLDLGFRRRHCMAGMLLDMLKDSIDASASNQQTVHRAVAIRLVRTLIAKHEGDSRYAGVVGRMQRIAMLYFPIVHMVLENLPRISTPSNQPTATTPSPFTIGESRDLLICFLWVVKHTNNKCLHYFWNHNVGDMGKMLDVLASCLSAFQYCGKDHLDNSRFSIASSTNEALRQLEMPYSFDKQRTSSSTDPTRRPTMTIDTSSPVRSDSVSSTTPPAFNIRDASGRKFRARQATMAKSDSARELENKLLAALSKETSMTIVDVINQICYHFSDVIGNESGRSDGSNPVTWRLIHLLTLFLHTDQEGTKSKSKVGGQCTEVLKHFFQTLILFVKKYDRILFCRQEGYSQKLAVCLLSACNSQLDALRDQAGVTLYILLKKNFSAMSAAITTALSKVAGESRSDSRLRASLATMIELARAEVNPPTQNFEIELIQLINRLIQVLRDTTEMQHYSDDPEMRVDLMCRIADSYSNTPELRVIWLTKVAGIHVAAEHWAEAAMTICHCAAVIAEHLKGEFSTFPPLNIGCKAFGSISPNLRNETTPGEFQVSTPLFSDHGIRHVLRKAVEYFKKAQLYELVSKCYMLFFPMLESSQNYSELAAATKDMHDCFNEIVLIKDMEKKRFLGTYFRVGFFGKKFTELDGAEFIYKEPNVTPLSELVLRLETLYGERFGRDSVTIIRDSKKVSSSALKPTEVYIQVTNVEPYHETAFTDEFDANHNIKRFVFETPFTESGKSHGSAETQCKRKTILETVNDLSFPFITKRLRIASSRDEVLWPLDVAIEEIAKKVKDLEAVVDAKPPDMVMLQMQVQGIVSMQVNAGPMEYASVFLGHAEKYDVAKIARLQEEFAYMIVHLERGISLNASLVSSDQAEYHDDLANKFSEMRNNLVKMLGESWDRISKERLSKPAGSQRNLFSEISATHHSVAPVNFMQDLEVHQGTAA